MTKTIRATARVQITVEIDASSWGDDCTIGQLHKQAADSAIDRVHSAFGKTEGAYRMIGAPKVIGILTETP